MRLIDVDATVERLNKHTLADGLFGAGITLATDRAIAVVHSAPTIDAVPIVRCRECKHFQADEIAVQSTGTCWHCEMVKNFDDFCSYGERKDGEG